MNNFTSGKFIFDKQEALLLLSYNISYSRRSYQSTMFEIDLFPVDFQIIVQKIRKIWT